MSGNPLRALPSIDYLASRAGPSHPLRGDALTHFLQGFLAAERDAIRQGRTRSRAEIVAAADEAVAEFGRSRLNTAINATGVVIHTNLGRAPVSDETAAAMARTAANAVALEIEPATNRRGGRMTEVAMLVRVLTGAEATLVVNNNAASIFLTITALASARSVIVSRGEAVEIGGGFRIPDVIRSSGAKLIDVGTTNRTYPADYESAVDDSTALFLKVHASNFSIEGFTSSTSVADIAVVARRSGLPVVADLGSGALLRTDRFGLQREETVGESIASGASIVTFSGDKLLGGPQAGFICGRADLVETIARHPIARAVRADKVCLAGVAATLRHYARDEAIEKVPVWRMIAAGEAELRIRADSLRSRLRDAGLTSDVVDSLTTIGGGSLPGQRQKSVALAFGIPSTRPEDLARRLRLGEPRVFGRIEDGRLLLDLRTILPEHDDMLFEAIVAAL